MAYDYEYINYKDRKERQCYIDVIIIVFRLGISFWTDPSYIFLISEIENTKDITLLSCFKDFNIISFDTFYDSVKIITKNKQESKSNNCKCILKKNKAELFEKLVTENSTTIRVNKLSEYFTYCYVHTIDSKYVVDTFYDSYGIIDFLDNNINHLHVLFEIFNPLYIKI